MLDNYTNSPDAKFLADIHRIADSLGTMSQSLAIIAGVLSRRDGIHYQQQPLTNTPTPPQSSSVPTPPSNHEQMTKEDTIPLQSTIETAYGTMNTDYSLPY